MRDYARTQTAILLRRLAYEVNRASKNTDADSVHDLRVAIRRLSRCLRTFSQFYPGRSWKKVRRRLKELMAAAGEVRDRDIAVELMQGAGSAPDSHAIKTLGQERHTAARHLTAELHHWKNSSLSRRWREELGL
jgi:CHAD domain-containing protein